MSRTNNLSGNVICFIWCITNLILLANLETLLKYPFSKYLSRISYNAGSIPGTKDVRVNTIHKNPHSCVAYILLARDRQ